MKISAFEVTMVILMETSQKNKIIPEKHKLRVLVQFEYHILTVMWQNVAVLKWSISLIFDAVSPCITVKKLSMNYARTL